LFIIKKINQYRKIKKILDVSFHGSYMEGTIPLKHLKIIAGR
jgi:hypothetical protein